MIPFPCPYCGADSNERCSPECFEAQRSQRESELTEKIVERAIERRDQKWHEWLEKFSVSIHEEFRTISDRLDSQDRSIRALGALHGTPELIALEGGRKE